MRVHVQVAGSFQYDVETSVARQQFEHVIQKADGRGYPGSALALQR